MWLSKAESRHQALVCVCARVLIRTKKSITFLQMKYFLQPVNKTEIKRKKENQNKINMHMQLYISIMSTIHTYCGLCLKEYSPDNWTTDIWVRWNKMQQVDWTACLHQWKALPWMRNKKTQLKVAYIRPGWGRHHPYPFLLLGKQEIRVSPEQGPPKVTDMSG